MNDSFQFMAIKVEVSTHENGASQKTVQITETPLERTNVVRYLKMMAFFLLSVMKMRMTKSFFFVRQPSIM